MTRNAVDRASDIVSVDEVIGIIHSYFPSKDPDGRLNENSILTSRAFRFSGKDLYRLLMVIEEEYCVYYQPDEIKKNGFKSPGDIAKLVNARRIVSGTASADCEKKGEGNNECCY